MELNDREPNRLINYDYSSNGLYFVTICTKKRVQYLSQITFGENDVGNAALGVPHVILTEYGKIVNDNIRKINEIYRYVSVIKYAKLVGLQNDGNLTDVQLTSKMLDLMNEKMPDLCVPFIELSDAALLAYMSDSEISDEISARGRNTYNDLRNRVFELMNPLQKLRAMWILGLY